MKTLIIFENYAAIIESESYHILAEEQLTLRSMNLNPNLAKQMGAIIVDEVGGVYETPPVHRRNIEQVVVYEQ